MTEQRADQDLVLQEILSRLVAAYQPERVYLFGSKARGETGPDSDYDMLLVVPDDASPERRRSQMAYQVLRGTRTAADVLVCTHSYFEARRHLRASLPGTVLREGRMLHKPTADRATAALSLAWAAVKGREGEGRVK